MNTAIQTITDAYTDEELRADLVSAAKRHPKLAEDLAQSIRTEIDENGCLRRGAESNFAIERFEQTLLGASVYRLRDPDELLSDSEGRLVHELGWVAP